MASKRRAGVRVQSAVAAVLITVLGSASASGASLFDPALRFRVLRTAHFHIYFHQGTETLAARLAAIAEDAWVKLERPLGVRPPPITHVILADQTEIPNAYATPLPRDTIVIYPTWPSGAEFDVHDWLRLVFTHEFTHIVHLDRSESWARAVRGMFGRTVLAFPNLFLPTWQIEGLATYEESALTGEGRLHAGDFTAIVGEAARRRAMEPLDRVNGGLTDWPGGVAPYAYGSTFHQYLAERFGPDTLAALAEATARRVPYTAAAAFRKVYGESLGQLWKEFEAARTGIDSERPEDEGPTRLTHRGFIVAGPRFDRACESCPNEIVYSARSPDGFPSLNRIDAGGGPSHELATRYFGSTTGIGRDALYFDQLEFHRNIALYGDLYRLTKTTGHVSRLTSGARLHDPDLSPDGSKIVAVQENAGHRDVVLISLNGAAAPDLDWRLTDPDFQFNAPRWSPDGRRFAVERHRLGTDPEIVVVDVASRAIQVVAAVRNTRIVMPAWRPDGAAIVAAVAPDDRPFNLVEFPLDGSPARQLTNTSGGATWPDISRDGRTIAFVGYTTDGYDIYTMPYPQKLTPFHPAARGAQVSERADAVGPPLPATGISGSRYSPLPTLKPTSWFPIIEGDNNQLQVGAATAGFDVLGYHAYAAAATWLASAPEDAVTSRRTTPDWFVSYAYDRWRPTFFVTAASETSFFAGPATDAGTPSSATRRERQIEGGLLLPFVRVRTSHAALGTLFRAVDDYTFADGTLSRKRTSLRAAWQTTTARTYGYSISQEDGVSGGTTIELIRKGLGASADATAFTADFRVYAHGFSKHHVVAARAAGGVSRGDRLVGRTFVLGGPSGEPSVIDFGSGAASLLRGFPSDSFAGSHVAVLNGEYRWPIARPQRGIGTWPVFLHTLHAAAIVDVGHAWTRAFDSRSIKTSVGGELSANVVAGFFLPLTFTVGIARGHDGSHTLADRTTVYFRVGKAF